MKRAAVIMAVLFIVIIATGCNEKFPAEDLNTFKKALAEAERGNAEAQNTVGYLYFYGKGVFKDQGKAVEWFAKSAAQNNSYGQYQLGICYLNGYGVPENGVEAVKWFMKSAAQGNALAQCGLATCYRYGEGVNRDYIKSAKWLRGPAEQGYGWAQLSLALCYEGGDGVNKDYAEAVKWYKKAASYQGMDNVPGQIIGREGAVMIVDCAEPSLIRDTANVFLDGLNKELQHK